MPTEILPPESKPSYSMKLNDARKLTPPVDKVGEKVYALREAMFDAITSDDVTSILAKQIEKAKSGDDTATKFIMGLIAKADGGGGKHQTNVVQVNGSSAGES